jgi:transcription elongation factor GreA
MPVLEAIPFTKEGLEKIRKELDHLRSFERPKVIQEIAEARAHGDLSENAEYAAAREKQGFVEARIAELEDKTSRAQVIEFGNDNSGKVKFGAFVTIHEESSGQERTVRIVGDLEADLDNGMISVNSPLAKALLGKTVDDQVEVRAPKGIVEYSIMTVRYN